MFSAVPVQSFAKVSLPIPRSLLRVPRGDHVCWRIATDSCGRPVTTQGGCGPVKEDHFRTSGQRSLERAARAGRDDTALAPCVGWPVDLSDRTWRRNG